MRSFAVFMLVLSVFSGIIRIADAQGEVFTEGDEVIVLGEATVLLIYAEPGEESQILEGVVSGFSLTILGESEEINGVIWWLVQSISGTEGWVPYTLNGSVTIGFADTDEADAGTSSEVSSGENATVITDTYVLLLSEQDVNSQPLEAIISGVSVLILAEPEIIDNTRWWYVEAPTGNQGWIAEDAEIAPVLLSTAELLALTPTTVPTFAPTATIPFVRLSGSSTANVLNVRRGPGPEYDSVRQLNNGASITVIGRNAQGTWVQLDTPDQQWINTQYASISGDVATLPVTFTEIGAWGTAGIPVAQGVSNSVVRVRGGPGSAYRQLENPDTIDSGTSLSIIGRSSDSLWYQVNVGNQSAWVNAQAVRLTSGNVNSIPITEPTTQAIQPTLNSASTTASTPVPTQASTVFCAGALPSRLAIGDPIEQILDSDPVRVQNEPGGGTTLFFVYPGNSVVVIGGPECHNVGNIPTTWWEIRGTNDWTGWVAEGNAREYYFEPEAP